MKRSVGKMVAALALATLTLFGSAFQIGANPSRNYDNTFEETINVWPETPGTDVFSYTGIAAYAQANEEPLTPPADNSVPAEDSAQGEGELPPGEDPSEEDSPEENPPEEEPPEENPPEENPPEENPPEEETPEEEPPELPLLYKDGLILVYTYEQLLLIGGGSAVTNADADTETLGTGEAVNDENGQAVSYSLSGRYTLTHDIALPPDVIWQLPEGFTAEQLVGVWRQEDYWDLRNHNETAYEAVFTEDGTMYLTAYKFVLDAGEITETLECGYSVENGALRLLEDALEGNLDDMVTELSVRSGKIVLSVQDKRKTSRIELIKTTEEIPKLYTVQP